MYVYIYIYALLLLAQNSAYIYIYIYMHFFYSQKTQHISKTHASISRKPSKFASNSTSTKFRFAPNKNPKHVLKAYANSSSTNRNPTWSNPCFQQQKTQLLEKTASISISRKLRMFLLNVGKPACLRKIFIKRPTASGISSKFQKCAIENSAQK